MIFKRYKPIHLLWIGVFALVFHVVLRLFTLSPSLILQLSNVVITLTNIVAFCCIVLLLYKPTRAQWFFILVLSVYVLWGMKRVVSVLFGEIFVITETVTSPFLMFLDGLLAMLFMLYPIEILRPHYLKFRTLLKILSPLLIITLQVIISNNLKSDGQEFMAKLLFISRTLTVVGYPLFTLIFLLNYQKLHKQWCEQNFSNLEILETSWVKYYIIANIFLSASYLYLMMNVGQEALLVHYTLLLLFFLFVFPFILSQKELIEYPEGDELLLIAAHDGMEEQSMKERLIYKSSSLMYKAKLLHWMEQDKPYLQVDFRLIDIMNVLPLNRSYISRLINEEIGETFFSFVMKYRVEESIRLLENRHDLTITQIAKECGFSSSSVFGRSFLKDKGMTPLEYRKQLMNANK